MPTDRAAFLEAFLIAELHRLLQSLDAFSPALPHRFCIDMEACGDRP